MVSTPHRRERHERAVRRVPGRSRVLLIGDSITQQSEPTFHRVLDDRYDLTVWGIGGSRADEHVHDDELVRAVDPDQVIINLGTNDVFQHTPPLRTIRALERIGSGCATARTVHLVTVSEGIFDDGSPVLRARSAELNARIAALAAAHGWGLIRWHTVARAYVAAGEPAGALTLDTVHPADAGRDLLAQAYRDALDASMTRELATSRCAPQERCAAGA